MPEFERYAYVTVKNSHGELAFRPMLPFMLSHGNHIVNVSGLLDSGGDVNVLPYRLGTELGLEWNEHRLVVGLSGNLANYEAGGVILYDWTVCTCPVGVCLDTGRESASHSGASQLLCRI